MFKYGSLIASFLLAAHMSIGWAAGPVAPSRVPPAGPILPLETPKIEVPAVSETFISTKRILHSVDLVTLAQNNFEKAFAIFVHDPAPQNEQNLIGAARNLGIAIAEAKRDVNAMINSLVSIEGQENQQIERILPQTRVPKEIQMRVEREIQQNLNQRVIGRPGQYNLMR